MRYRTTAQMKSAIEKMVRLYDDSERLFDVDEDASDRAYNEASAICADLTTAIVRASHGMINRITARAMVLGKPDRLIAICEKF